MKPKQKSFLQNLDWVTTILPFGCITLLCCLFMIFPEGSANILASIRFFLGDQLGSYYLLMGLGAVICSLYMAFSRFGSIKLGAMGMKGMACLPISKQLDPVIGVDIHLVTIPPSPVVPMPHPYVGILLVL